MYVYTYIHYTPQIYDNIRANFPRFHNRIDTGRTRKIILIFPVFCPQRHEKIHG